MIMEQMPRAETGSLDVAASECILCREHIRDPEHLDSRVAAGRLSHFHVESLLNCLIVIGDHEYLGRTDSFPASQMPTDSQGKEVPVLWVSGMKREPSKHKLRQCFHPDCNHRHPYLTFCFHIDCHTFLQAYLQQETNKPLRPI